MHNTHGVLRWVDLWITSHLGELWSSGGTIKDKPIKMIVFADWLTDISNVWFVWPLPRGFPHKDLDQWTIYQLLIKEVKDAWYVI